MITHDRINDYFGSRLTIPGGTVFADPGFTALADWSERQAWWPDFAEVHALHPGWRSTSMGDTHLFAVNLFAFLNFRLCYPEHADESPGLK
ncbi:hypothetical protein [Geomesophilobacter sediminis]|uniref:Uncharacterized protein n=1 Tax=Geomesophilobacter sediminis TaxID=2798584 RepID=A0A8J7JDW1_9BACT|nr:hypothetical protein [Geomesophilobacter sediminis]MBJ6725468.1 hypothetical protein [Geomesophilobacter sediminis]